jgi:glycosyltransferase involved in cell wall biosynthesis
MTGDGPELAEVRKLIARYGLQDRIHAPGFVDDPWQLMMAVDVVVVPSRLDGMPLVVMESQAIAKPVVASAVGSIPVMVANGQTGLLCEPGNIADFARRIRELFASPVLRARIGTAARKSVVEHHSSAAMLRRYEEVFAKARAAHGRSAQAVG